MNQDQIQALLDQLASYALDAVGALVILLVGWWIAGRAQYLVRRALDRVPRIDDTLKPFLSSSVRYLVIVIAFVAVLAEFGVQTTSIIAVLGAAGLAIGLALQGTLQNIAAGIMLLVLRPFRVGEYIDAGGVSGTVDAINLFTTDMTTYDGIYRSVPNAELWNRNILNDWIYQSALPMKTMSSRPSICCCPTCLKILGYWPTLIPKFWSRDWVIHQSISRFAAGPVEPISGLFGSN